MLNYTLYENGNILVTPCFDRIIPDKSNGKKQKFYTIDAAAYRKVASSAVNLWAAKRHNITFFTLTFPFLANESEANICFSKFVENLKQNYGLKNYIATKERGEIGNRLHFHCLFDLPFRDIRRLNKAWCNTFKNIAPFSPNAVSLPDRKHGGAVVRTQERCVKYLCKYLSKSKNQQFEKPCLFISRQILSKPQRINADIVNMLEDTFESFYYEKEYFKVICLKNAYLPKNDSEPTEKKQINAKN